VCVEEAMTRTLELRVQVPAILFRGWTPSEQDWTTVPFRKGALTGEVSLRLDPEAIYAEEWYEDGLVGEASCDRVVVRIEGQCDSTISEEAWLRVAQELTDEYLNRMLSYIKSELQQYWVTTVPVSEWNLHLFIAKTSPKWLTESDQSEVRSRYAAVIVDLPVMEFYDRRHTLGTGAWADIGGWIDAQDVDPALLAKTALANAKRSFEENNYAMAAIETITALDLAVPRFVKDRHSRQSISLPSTLSIGRSLTLLQSVLPARELDNWLSQQDAWLRRPARRSPDRFEPTGQSITAQCIELNRLRNDIVHEAHDPRDDADIKCVKHGILAAEWLLDFIAQDLTQDSE
jgi:hypothetical protein